MNLGKTVKYITIYRPYKIPALISLAKSDKEGTTNQESRPLKDWNTAVDEYATKGYEIVNSGTIVSGDSVIFWALLKETMIGKF
jgi:hypothetical protein